MAVELLERLLLPVRVRFLYRLVLVLLVRVHGLQAAVPVQGKQLTVMLLVFVSMLCHQRKPLMRRIATLHWGQTRL